MKSFPISYLAAVLMLSATACSREPVTEPAPAVGSALYRVTFEATWSANTHGSFPAGAHFSPLIGLSHRPDGLVFQPGRLASLGIKNVAEIGNNTALRSEITSLRSSQAALALFDGRAGTNSPGTLTDTIRLDAQHPRLTVVTMIAPSPDWFAALENEDLLSTGQWAAHRMVPARAYDAGTDSGPGFTSPDQPTSPADAIRLLDLPPATGTAATGPPVGYWHLERLK